MTRRLPSRLAVLALPVLLAGTLSACGGDDGTVASAPGSAAPSVSPLAPSTASQVPADAQPAQDVRLTVKAGKVTGDTGRVQVKVGSRVRLTVLADVSDEIHVHGYDLMQDISANQPGQVEFVADKPGVYEVELEKSRVQLTRLQVQ